MMLFGERRMIRIDFVHKGVGYVSVGSLKEVTFFVWLSLKFIPADIDPKPPKKELKSINKLMTKKAIEIIKG